MSYTPEDQKSDIPIEKYMDASSELEDVILARIRNYSEWNSKHIDDIRKLLNNLLDMRSEINRIFP
jgi:hypothetical protein